MENLKTIRKRNGISQEEIAKYLGVTQSQYSRYEAGYTTIPNDLLNKLADYFGVSVDMIFGRVEIEQPKFRELKINYVPETEETMYIPVVASLKCGYGAAGDPFTLINKIPVPKSYKRYGENLVAIIATGDSMTPTIPPGTFLICCPGDTWEDGQIVAVNVNDSDTVKRIYHAEDGGIQLVPDNPKYKTQVFTRKEIEELQIKVLGRIRKGITPDL